MNYLLNAKFEVTTAVTTKRLLSSGISESLEDEGSRSLQNLSYYLSLTSVTFLKPPVSSVCAYQFSLMWKTVMLVNTHQPKKFLDMGDAKDHFTVVSINSNSMLQNRIYSSSWFIWSRNCFHSSWTTRPL